MLNKLRSDFNNRALALTIARRSMRRNLAQTILIILIIAMPVSVATFAFTYVESSSFTPTELVKYNLGKTQARFTPQMSADANAFDKHKKTNLYQLPLNDSLFAWAPGGSTPPELQGSPIDPRTLGLVSGSWLTERSDTVLVKTAGGVDNLMVIEGRPWDAAFADRYTLISGRSPRSDAEVMATPATLERLGIKLGDELIMPTLKETRSVVGTLSAAKLPSKTSAIFASVANITGVLPESDPDNTAFYLVGSKPVAWKTVVEFNRFGIGVLSQSVVLNPPADSAVPALQNNYYERSLSDSLGKAFTLAILLFTVLIPVAVLAGSAFSFGARRQAKSLAILSSLGARKRHLRFLNVANGIWLGMLGGVVGDLLGVISAWVLMPMITNGSKNTYPGFHLPWWVLAALVLGGAAIGAIVSLIPAIAATKIDVLSTLRGVRAGAKVKKRAGIGGLLVIASGIVITVIGSKTLNDFVASMQATQTFDSFKLQLLQLIPVGGTVVILTGFLLSTGWLLVFVRALFKKTGAATNYATNDLIYNRKRYQSVVAAAIATSFLAATVMGVVYSAQTTQAAQYRPVLPKNQILIDPLWSITDYSQDDLGQSKPRQHYEQLLTASKQDLEKQLRVATSVADWRSANIVARHVPLSTLGFSIDPATGNPTYAAEDDQPLTRVNAEYLCPWNSQSPSYRLFKKLQRENNQKQIKLLESFPKYRDCDHLTWAQETIYIGTAKDLEALLGKSAPDSAVNALQSGQAVSFLKGFENHAKITLDWYPSGSQSIFNVQESQQESVAGGPEFQVDDAVTSLVTPELKKSATLESVFVETVSRDLTIMISPETADSLGIDYKSNILVVNYKNDLTVDERDMLNEQLANGFQIDEGYGQDPDAWAWIILAIASFFVIASMSISLGLAQIESRPDQSTLGSIGAPRRFRAKVLSQQAFILTALGTILGSVAGLYLSFVVTDVTGFILFRVATIQLALLVLGVPALSALIFWFGTSRRSIYRVRLALD